MTRNPLTLAYSLRHLGQRKIQTLMTLIGIALVVFVFVATLMLAQGVQKTLVSTGDPDNIICVMTGAQSEVESGVTREAANVIRTQTEVVKLGDGRRMATADLTVLITLHKRSDHQTSNVTMRGISAEAWDVRPQAKLTAGRLFHPGTQEIIVGKSVNRKFENTGLGQTIRLVGTDWKVVGLFDVGNTAFSSEIWGDVNILMPSFRREQFSSVTFKPRRDVDYQTLKNTLEKDPRLGVSVMHEPEFYEAQSKDLATFIRYLGGFVSVVFSLGAVIGAMITMYSAVATRVREIGILRAIGFSRASIFSAFVKECLLMGLLGGILGIILASSLSVGTFATTNFASWADVTFGFQLTPGIAAAGVAFALIMSFIGGALPALQAARVEIVDSLRAE
jgi:putative ABC transport system permease protein